MVRRNGTGSNTGAGYPQSKYRVMIPIAPFIRPGPPRGSSNLTLPPPDHRYINIRYIFGILAALTPVVRGRLQL
jgi:hypothetical protein